MFPANPNKIDPARLVGVIRRNKSKKQKQKKKKSIPKIKSQIYVLKMVDIGRERGALLSLINKALET